MKRSNITSVSTILAVALGLGSAASAQNNVCTNATLQGSFGYKSTGTLLKSYVLPPFAGPFAEVGIQTFDANDGTTSATATLSSNGNIVSVTVTGTYTVNPDCTGTVTLLISPFNATVHANLVIDKNGNAFQAIETEPGLIVTRMAWRQFSDSQ
jgi:hypothetical protein